MEDLIDSVMDSGEGTSANCSTNATFNGDPNSQLISQEGSMVILRSNPLELPMVCGLCGSQYATARELENHLDVHRTGLQQAKRGRGRPRGSRGKRPNGEELRDLEAAEQPEAAAVVDPRTSFVDDDDSGTSQSRRNHRPAKRLHSDIYVRDEKELDDLIKADSRTYIKGKLPKRTKGGVQIARLEDYTNTRMIVAENADETKSEGLTVNDLTEGDLLNARMDEHSDMRSTLHELQSTDSGDIRQPVTQTSIEVGVEHAMNDFLSTKELNEKTDNPEEVTDSIINSTTHDDESSLDVNDEDTDDNVTHIEVCLEVFGNDFSQQSGSAGDDPHSEEGKKAKMCELCFSVMPSHQMREHMLGTHMNSSTQEFVCPKEGCGKLFNTITNLRQHMSEGHQSPVMSSFLGPKSYKCEIEDCTTVFKSRNALRNHMIEAHEASTNQATTCEICKKTFKSKRAQSSHMKAHTKTLEAVSCPQCHKEFKHSSALKFHRSMVPECDKPKYVCQLCGYKAVTPWRLNSHQQQVHSTERPFTCEYCQKTYKTNEMLRQHTHKLHTGTPTFECDVCHKKYFYAAELREHSQLHLTTKNFVCPICHRAFKTMHVFRGHMNGKHSDTWFSCGFCKFTTSHKKSMKRHMVLVHKLKNVTLEVTPEENVNVEPQQVEIIQNNTDLQNLQLSETGQVIGSIQHVQYDDVENVVLQHGSDEIITHEQMTGEVITHGEMSGEVITDEHLAHDQVITHGQMDAESLRQLINTHGQAVVVDGSMNASEVSQVLVSLSNAQVITYTDADHMVTTESGGLSETVGGAA